MSDGLISKNVTIVLRNLRPSQQSFRRNMHIHKWTPRRTAGYSPSRRGPVPKLLWAELFSLKRFSWQFFIFDVFYIHAAPIALVRAQTILVYNSCIFASKHVSFSTVCLFIIVMHVFHIWWMFFFFVCYMLHVLMSVCLPVFFLYSLFLY